MQEELKEIEILVLIYKMLKEKAEPKMTKCGGNVYSCSDGGMFELFISETDADFLIGGKSVSKEKINLIQESCK